MKTVWNWLALMLAWRCTKGHRIVHFKTATFKLYVFYHNKKQVKRLEQCVPGGVICDFITYYWSLFCARTF